MSDLKVYTYTKQKNFSIVGNELLNNIKLSDSAFRTLIWMLNRPDDWQLNTKSIAAIRGYSVGKASAISKELQEHGFLLIEKLSSGRTVWHISEVEGSFRKGALTDECETLTRSDVEPDSKKWNEGKKPNSKKPNSKKPNSKKPNSKNCNVLVRTEGLVRTEDINNISSTSANENLPDTPNKEQQAKPIDPEWEPAKEVMMEITCLYPEKFIKNKYWAFLNYWLHNGGKRKDWDGKFKLFLADGWEKEHQHYKWLSEQTGDKTKSRPAIEGLADRSWAAELMGAAK